MLPPSVVRRSDGHRRLGHELLTPSTYPVAVDTNVADLGSNPPGTEEPAGSLGPTGVVADGAAVVVGVEAGVEADGEMEVEVELATRLALVGFVVAEPPE